MAKQMKAKDVDEYINNFSGEAKARLEQVRKLVKRIAPEVEEKISWNMPGYKLDGRPLVYFAGFKNHIGLYPLPETVTEYQDELSNYHQGKGSIQFPNDKPLPVKLIEKIIKANAHKIKAGSL